jgi:pyruvate dehydrogenase E1 component alpha subunit
MIMAKMKNGKSSATTHSHKRTKKEPTAFPDSPKKEKLDLLRKMLLIRQFEEKAAQAFMQAKIKGFCHLYIGQEAVAVGTISVLKPTDAVITAYRDHGHGLARGMTPNECMAELFGKITGCSRGKGGSMHFFSKEKHFYGGHGIVAGQTPLGAGIAFGQKYLKNGGVTLCYLGDGAINQGSFHESLNLAALWKRPVIYVIENNEYAMGTSVARSSAGDPLSKRALGYDMESVIVDGMDIDEVRAKTTEVVKRARTESLPALMEIKTYRYRGHSMSDPGNYRTREEIEKHKKADPILIYRARLMDEGILDNAIFDKMSEEVHQEVEAAYEFADKSPDPEFETVFEDIFTPETQIDEISRERRE